VRCVTDFINEAVAYLDRHTVPRDVVRIPQKLSEAGRTYYDVIAEMVNELIERASTVPGDGEVSWHVQYSSVWDRCLGESSLSSPAGLIVKAKARRLMLTTIVRLRSLPDYQNARLIAFVLRIMGLKLQKGSNDRANRPLHRAILRLVKEQYRRVASLYPLIADEMRPEGVEFDSSMAQLVQMPKPSAWQMQPEATYFRVD
jgi:hypothetical protein